MQSKATVIKRIIGLFILTSPILGALIVEPKIFLSIIAVAFVIILILVLMSFAINLIRD